MTKLSFILPLQLFKLILGIFLTSNFWTITTCSGLTPCSDNSEYRMTFNYLITARTIKIYEQDVLPGWAALNLSAKNFDIISMNSRIIRSHYGFNLLFWRHYLLKFLPIVSCVSFFSLSLSLKPQSLFVVYWFPHGPLHGLNIIKL